MRSGGLPEMDWGTDRSRIAGLSYTFAAGGRAYTSGARHRGYVELSVSQILTVQDGQDFVNGEWVPDAGHRLYGPGLQLGY